MDKNKQRVLRGFRFFYVLGCCAFATLAFMIALLSWVFYRETLPVFLWFSGLSVVYYLWAEELKRDESKA